MDMMDILIDLDGGLTPEEKAKKTAEMLRKKTSTSLPSGVQTPPAQVEVQPVNMGQPQIQPMPGPQMPQQGGQMPAGGAQPPAPMPTPQMPPQGDGAPPMPQQGAGGPPMPPQGGGAPPMPPQGGGMPAGPQSEYDRLMAMRDQYQQQLEKASAAPDYTKLQETYKKRKAGSGQNLLLALAAAQAGKEYAPMQGVFLKEAMAAREPMKIAGGEITDEGVMLDPAYQQLQKQKMIESRIGAIDKALTGTLDRDSRERLARERNELMGTIAAGNQAIRASTAAAAAEARAARAGERQDRDRDQMEYKLSTQYAKASEDMNKVIRGADAIKANLPEALAGNAQAQMGMVYQFMRGLDPGSVVRESEYAMAANARPLIGVVEAFQNQLMNGGRLTRQQVKQMVEVSEKLAEVARSGRAEVEQQIAERARGYGARPEFIFGKKNYGTPAAPAAPAAPTGPTVKWNDLGGGGGAPAAAPAGGVVKFGDLPK